MIRLAAFLSLFVGAVALAQPSAHAGTRVPHEGPRRAADLDGDPALLRTLPTSGAGMPYATTTFCADYASSMVGNFVCQNGDGTTLAGSMAQTVTGAPATVTPRVCGTGPDCGAMSAVQTTASAYYSYGSTALASDFTMCALVDTNDPATNQIIMIEGASNGDSAVLSVGSNVARFESNAANSTTGSIVASSTITGTGVRLICGVYTRVGGVGNNSGVVYVDGVSDGTSNTMRLINTVAAPLLVGVNIAHANPFLGRVYMALKTDTALSPGTMTSMKNALIPTLTTKQNGAITFTRASVATVVAPDSTLTTVPSGRMRVAKPSGATGGMLLVEGANTNLLLRDRDLSNASWTKTTMTCAADRTGVDGVANSASTCTATAPAALVAQIVTTASATRTTSLDLKRITGTGNIDLARDAATFTTLTATQCADIYTGAATAPNASTWVRCQLSGSVLNPALTLRLATSGDVVAVDFFGDENNPFASSRIATAAASATRVADDALFAPPAVSVLGCGGALVSPGWNATSGFGAGFILASTAPDFRPLYVDTANVYIYASDSVVSAAWTPLPGAVFDLRSNWSGSVKNIFNITGSTSGTGAFTSPGFAAAMRIGNRSTLDVAFYGYIGNIRFGASTGACNK